MTMMPIFLLAYPRPKEGVGYYGFAESTLEKPA